MDNNEARDILATELARYRIRSYAELQRLLDAQDTVERTGPSGTKYQLEVEAVWDDEAGGNLRVIAHVDNRGWRAFVPLSHDFIIAPNGTFVGE